MLFKLIIKMILLAVISLLVFVQPASAQDGIIDLKFSDPPVSDSDTSRTLESLAKAQGTGGPCQRGLYLMTHCGEREDLFQAENQGLIDNSLVNQTWRYCGMSETLQNTRGNLSWETGMEILQDVKQIGTTWSLIYSHPTAELFFSVYQKWDTIYHLRMP